MMLIATFKEASLLNAKDTKAPQSVAKLKASELNVLVFVMF